MVDFYSDGTEIPRDEFNMKLNEILKQEECIIDGSYLRTHELRIKYCDIIFFIEFQIDLCLMNSESRIGKEREDLPWEATDKKEENIYYQMFGKEREYNFHPNFYGIIIFLKL